MQPIRITKDVIGDVIRLFPSYVSNGRWLAHRGLIANVGIFSSIASAQATYPKARILEEKDDSLAERVIPKGGKIWTKTPWLRDGTDCLIRIFKADDGMLAYLDERYVKALALSELIGSDPLSAFSSYDGRLAVMPMVIQGPERMPEAFTR